MLVKLTPSKDGKTAVLSWVPPANAAGYIATIDGQPHSSDGIRHFSLNGALSSMKIGLLQDGKSHAYGVDVLTVTDSGSAIHPPKNFLAGGFGLLFRWLT